MYIPCVNKFYFAYDEVILPLCGSYITHSVCSYIRLRRVNDLNQNSSLNITKLTVVEVGIETVLSKQLFVISALDNISVFHYEYQISVLYRR